MLVYENSLWIKVIAQKGAETIDEVQVRINNTSDGVDSDGIYRLPLKNGANNLRVTAGSGVNQQVFTCTVNYKRDDMALTFESAAVTETVSGTNSFVRKASTNSSLSLLPTVKAPRQAILASLLKRALFAE